MLSCACSVFLHPLISLWITFLFVLIKDTALDTALVVKPARFYVSILQLERMSAMSVQGYCNIYVSRKRERKGERIQTAAQTSDSQTSEKRQRRPLSHHRLSAIQDLPARLPRAKMREPKDRHIHKYTQWALITEHLSHRHCMTDGSLEDEDVTPWTPRRCQKHSSFLCTSQYSRDFPVSSGCLIWLRLHMWFIPTGALTPCWSNMVSWSWECIRFVFSELWLMMHEMKIICAILY